MTFAHVLLICTGAIAGCAALVFLVETLVAFCFHPEERTATVGRASSMQLDTVTEDLSLDKAA